MRKNVVAIVGAAIFASEAIWMLYKFFRARRERRRSSGEHKSEMKAVEPFTDVMFFTKDSALCRPHLSAGKPCGKLNCAVRFLRELISHMDKAEKSINVCMFFLTCTVMCDALINAHKRGVHVRIITDSHMGDSGLTQALEFYKCGIVVRLRELDVLMHHKFVVIDNSIVMSGSINWTMAAFFGNYENIVVTNNEPMVRPFAQQFEKLWIDFEAPVNFEQLSAGFKHMGKNSLNDRL